ncbi:hypothetical protein M1558_00920 [Candidatus Parvarchaeota archaeon]|nr:hypothetical protein [Candidatus Parvarchaeota archaeon]
MDFFKEGKVKFFAEDKQLKKAEVFFNPKRKFDRDLNVLLVSSLMPENSSGLELFSGSGVRGLRLCIETGKFSVFSFNDIKSSGIVEKNLEANRGKLLKIDKKVTGFDAASFEAGKKYDYIDIDPFGSPVFYLNSALKLLKKNGILAVSATDTAALMGSAQKACMRKYGSVSLKTAYSNELGIRILIKKVMEEAAAHSIKLLPLLFNFEGNFLRVYFKSISSNGKEKIGYAYQCSKCPSRQIKEEIKCSYCGSNVHRIGKLWLGPLYSKKHVIKMLSALNENNPDFAADSVLKLSDYLTRLSKELDVFSYYTTSQISSFLKQPELSMSGFKDKTVLSPKGFRIKESFSDFLNNNLK